MLVFGLYEQVINQIIRLNLEQLDKKMIRVEKHKLDSAESSKILAEYMAKLIRQVLDYVSGDDSQILRDRVDLCNSLINHVIELIDKGEYGVVDNPHLMTLVKDHIIQFDAMMLLALADKQIQLQQGSSRKLRILRPETSLAENALFTGAQHEPSMMTELKKEIINCDQIDLLVSFIKWSGLRLLIDDLKRFTAQGGRLRIITTSYMGATDYKAVERLARLPHTEVRISYDTNRTRLHAKTYIFWRKTGFSSVYIGSSNMSQSAMTSGLEWNIKLSEYDSRDIMDKIRVTFESYWNNPEFVPFIPEVNSARLRRALNSERDGSGNEGVRFAFNFEITPYYYQQEILDRLKAEREIHNFYRNLIVAATGTGKTVMAAFDYRRFQRECPYNHRLLFVAHRKEILQQSLDCFRGVLKDYNFGSLMVGGVTPDSLEHLFVSIQSLNSKDLTAITPSDYYDYIVVDEFHHAAAQSYQLLLQYYQPRILLGLTATPERADGQSVFKYFDSRIAAELRLGEAIERKLLSPFHYFGVTDSVSLRNLRWSRGGYEESELENLYVFNREVAMRRVDNILQAIDRYCGESEEIVGIGFCVSQPHASFMAKMFNRAGIPADYLTAQSPPEVRDTVKERLVRKEINFVFVVDLYNEGVDIPEVNTVLFLRPTESLTVFLQQLGRGLRLCEGKEALTVLDFVGQARREFNFEQRFKALLSRTRKTVSEEIKRGFVNVPRGCSIQLEKKAEEYILKNIRETINNRANIMAKLADSVLVHPTFDAAAFFEDYHVRPQDIYKTKHILTPMAARVFKWNDYEELDQLLEKRIADGFMKLSFANSRRWLGFLLKTVPHIKSTEGASIDSASDEEQLMLTMLHYTFWRKGLNDLDKAFCTIEKAIFELIKHDYVYMELMALLKYQFYRIDFVDKPINLGFPCPLDLHCAYTLDQILVAVGKHQEEQKSSFREGVLYLADKGLDVFFITLNKSEKDYSPSTMYRDYAVSESLFHWESQSTTTVQSTTGRRYISNKHNGNRILIFVREYRTEDNAAMPYTCLGLADYVSHSGTAPISIIWRMREDMPAFVLKEAIKA